jgi:hypothetical protein
MKYQQHKSGGLTKWLITISILLLIILFVFYYMGSERDQAIVEQPVVPAAAGTAANN